MRGIHPKHKFGQPLAEVASSVGAEANLKSKIEELGRQCDLDGNYVQKQEAALSQNSESQEAKSALTGLGGACLWYG